MSLLISLAGDRDPSWAVSRSRSMPFPASRSDGAWLPRVHLVVGSPLGLPSAGGGGRRDGELRVAVERSRARAASGLGDRASSPAGTARRATWSRFPRVRPRRRRRPGCWPSSGGSASTGIRERPSIWTGIQQVEPDAYLTLMARPVRRPGAEILAAGRSGGPGTRRSSRGLPSGPALRDADPAARAGLDARQILQAVLRLRRARHRPQRARHATEPAAGGAGVRDFHRASSSAPAARLDDDLAAVLAALAVQFGVERTAAAAARALDAASARGALVHLQRSASILTPSARCGETRACSPQLRAAVALAAGIEVPELAEAKRIARSILRSASGH